jgi:hypothetical protein
MVALQVLPLCDVVFLATPDNSSESPSVAEIEKPLMGGCVFFTLPPLDCLKLCRVHSPGTFLRLASDGLSVKRDLTGFSELYWVVLAIRINLS